ncbi:branched chain amino acid ABC transporter substrate-binding protein [Niveispirillum lacus]|uniref:Branched chain amino acid ABC transporter substrate-binding protein n=1 Tax=Niveispirillum lacus TaxID=1981099 RepID=A0A255YWV9_9PROT|nr:branched-chain amino acid ABC transporter substrate-binding protein [Niveispirillum lacus]OYQ33661.1 branched chain amino acid ABC transporter substrate-binding protein [Niveispirillum lacus]
MNLKKSFAAALAAATMLTAMPAFADTIVGLVAPLTGPNAVFGEQMRRGAEMAVADINAKGGLLGEKLVLVNMDDASNPSQGVAIANKLATQGGVAAFGNFNSAVSIPSSKVFADEGIVMISPASTNPQLTEQGLTTVFRTCGRDDQQGDVAAAWLLKNHKDGKIAVIHDQTTYGRGLAEATRAALNKGGKKEVMFDAVNVGDRDMSALVTKMKDAGVNVVYFGGLHTEAGLLVRQMADAGLKAVFMSGDGVVNQEFWNIAGTSAEGALVTFGNEYRDKPEAADVVKRFRSAGFEPEAYTLYTYAAVQVWAGAATKAKTVDADKVAASIRDGVYTTVIGPLSFDAKGDRKVTDYIVYRWSNGKYTPIPGQ